METLTKNPINEIAPALLEGWMRDYYFSTEIDIGSSGVENFSLTELYQLTNLTQEELNNVVFHDSSSLGSLQLRQAIASRWSNGDPEQVMVTHGSSEANFLIMNGLLNAGDEVVVLDPCYQQLFSIAESIGCQLKRWQLRGEDNFAPNIEEAKKLITPRTRMVIVNFPHNPTGVSLSQQEQNELIEAVTEVGAYLVWDAAFADIVYDGILLSNPNLYYDRSISMGTFSKCYGLPGLRFGWCLASKELLEGFVHLRDYMTLHLSPMIELIAQRVVEKADNLLSIRLQQAYTNLDILSKWVEEHKEFVRWSRPQGGVCTFMGLRSISDSEAFCHHLANVYKVLLVPGTCFNHPSHVRLGFGGATSDLKEGLSRLSTALVTDF
ncbi:MAG: capreomycidine synthase [Pelatocladus maniniholoensis HA4357-MV3]|jgi:capreomycidine synthase|uniref:Capreomycidine synthase n=1 Tax=Pelatocladus maniniholoensis HA4357-MV3 TaxID=1117104 RepID=A0A9E3H7R1_9NOST|nr:capreomycidine synthase [Pelatocladus maniniholoensis HA4357-MV3]